MEVGVIAVTTMPLLHVKELGWVLDKGEIGFVLCDARLVDELRDAVAQAAKPVQMLCFRDDMLERLEAVAAHQSVVFVNTDTVIDDTCLFVLISGATGVPKTAMHSRHDTLAIYAY